MLIEFAGETMDVDSLTTEELLQVQLLTAQWSSAATPWPFLDPRLRMEDAAAILTVLLARHVGGVVAAADLVAAVTLAEWRAMFRFGEEVPDGVP